MPTLRKPENIAEALVVPKDAEFIAWAEQAPKRCLIIADDSVRFEAFTSHFEFLAWLRHVVPEKSELLATFTKAAIEDWERTHGTKLPDARRKP